MRLSTKRHGRQSEPPEQKKAKQLPKKSGFPIYNAFSAEKRVQKAKIPIIKHDVQNTVPVTLY